MELSAQQDAACVAFQRWYREPFSRAPWWYLGGFAGSGKTTIAKHLAEDVGGEVRYAAPTGKAAHVLRSKGCANAQTIHSLIYAPKTGAQSAAREKTEELEDWLEALEEQLAALGPRPDRVPATRPGVDFGYQSKIRPWRDLDGKIEDLRAQIAAIAAKVKAPKFSLREDGDARSAALLVIDECSMIDGVIANDLLSLGVKILVLGDPAQLPPVMGEGYFTRGDPHFMLTEIHRQAAESGVLRMATDVREGRGIRSRTYGDDAVVVPRGERDIIEAAVLTMDQMLVGRNATRHLFNARVREMEGRGAAGPMPVGGDKLVCLRNDREAGLLNGSLWRVHEALATGTGKRDSVAMTISSDDGSGGTNVAVTAHAAHFLGKEKEIPFYELRERSEFTYGYALTVHRGQGSQWDDVVIFDESGAFARDGADKQRAHLYTAITRAAKRVTVVPY